MRAIYFERTGGPEVLELTERPAPTPGEGEVLVDVEAIGINYRDVYEREGGATARHPRPSSASRAPAGSTTRASG
jgi:NADPH:quinone reductase-like Zn-dependent oxidoreductase